MNSKELARQINASPDDITYWARKGKIPGRKVGRQWRFNQKSLLAAKERLEELRQ
jgi:excisionase family DNA binding protein